MKNQPNDIQNQVRSACSQHGGSLDNSISFAKVGEHQRMRNPGGCNIGGVFYTLDFNGEVGEMSGIQRNKRGLAGSRPRPRLGGPPRAFPRSIPRRAY